jgi:putative transposase
MSEVPTPRWPHAPAHLRDAQGAVMFTAATYKQVPRFNSRPKLDFLQSKLFELAEVHGFALQAWAIFPNHYHFIAHIERPSHLAPFARKLHASTGNFLNEVDAEKGRQVWFQYWDSKITFERSYYARLHYVHRNAVHHGIVKRAANYPWCSAAWFEREAVPSFRETVLRFRTDKLNVHDPFEVKRNDFNLT